MKKLFIIHGLWGVTEFEKYSSIMKESCNFEINYINFNHDKNINTFEELVNEHIKTIKEIQNKGPYYLMGFSYAGVIANNILEKLTCDQINVFFSIDCAHIDRWEHSKKRHNRLLNEAIIYKYVYDKIINYNIISNLKFIQLALCNNNEKLYIFKQQNNYTYIRVPNYNSHSIRNLNNNTIKFICNAINEYA